MSVIAIAAPFALAATPPDGDVISNKLTADITATSEGQVLLSWITAPPANVVLNKSYETEVRLKNQTDVAFANALIIVEINRDGKPASPDDVTIVSDSGYALGYDASGEFFFYGPRHGFEIGPDYDVSTKFTNTIHTAGDYDVKIYVVNLDE